MRSSVPRRVPPLLLALGTGLLVASLACTAGPQAAAPAATPDVVGVAPGATPVPPPSSRVTLPAVVVSGSGPQAQARVVDVTVTASARPAGAGSPVSLGPAATRSGPFVRAGAWTAATAAFLALDLDPAVASFEVEVGAPLDGPAATASMALAALAAARKDAILPGTAIAALVNPDGTLGAVSNLVERVDAAAGAGITTLIIPAGQRQGLDPAQNRAVDVVRRGDERGLRVLPAATIQEAYLLATGASLPVPPATGDPVLAPAVQDALSQAASTWITRHDEVQARIRNQAATLREPVQADTAAAQALADEARRAQNEGAAALAWARAVSAVERAEQAEEQITALQALRTRSFQDALAIVRSGLGLDLPIQGLRARLDGTEPQSMTDALGLLDAYRWLVRGEASRNLVTLLGDSLPANQASLGNAQREAALREMARARASARVSLDAASTSLAVYQGRGGGGPVPSLAVVSNLAEVLARAMEANMASFDAAVLGARLAPGQRAADAQQVLTRNEPLYGRALALAQAVTTYANENQKAPRTNLAYAALAGAQEGHIASALLLAKYYSLGGALTPAFEPVSLRTDLGLAAALRSAEQRADVLVRTAPEQLPTAISLLEVARADREGTTAQKLAALGGFWEASLESGLRSVLAAPARALFDPDGSPGTSRELALATTPVPADQNLPFPWGGVVFRAPSCGVPSISGTVTNEAGLPVNGVTVRLTGGNVQQREVVTAGQGTFGFVLGSAPVAGTWQVALFDGNRRISAPVTVSTTGQDRCLPGSGGTQLVEIRFQPNRPPTPSPTPVPTATPQPSPAATATPRVTPTLTPTAKPQ